MKGRGLGATLIGGAANIETKGNDRRHGIVDGAVLDTLLQHSPESHGLTVTRRPIRSETTDGEVAPSSSPTSALWRLLSHPAAAAAAPVPKPDSTPLTTHSS